MSMSTKPATLPPTSAKSGGSSAANRARQEFFTAAMNMSWQLAIAVLVPLLGGYTLDKHFGTLPVLTIIGFVLAMSGMGLVVWYQLQRFKPTVTQADIDNAKRLRDQEEHDD